MVIELAHRKVVGAMTKDIKSNVIVCFVFLIGFSLLVLFLVGSLQKEDRKNSYLNELQFAIDEIKEKHPTLVLYRVSVFETSENTYYSITYLMDSIKEDVIYNESSKTLLYLSQLNHSETILYEVIEKEMKDATHVYLYELNLFD